MNNPLDNYFRDHLKKRKFNFDPADWEGAKLLLHPDKKGKNRWAFFWLFIGFILVIGLTAIYFNPTNGTNLLSNEVKKEGYALDKSPNLKSPQGSSLSSLDIDTLLYRQESSETRVPDIHTQQIEVTQSKPETFRLNKIQSSDLVPLRYSTIQTKRKEINQNTTPPQSLESSSYTIHESAPIVHQETILKNYENKAAKENENKKISNKNTDGISRNKNRPTIGLLSILTRDFLLLRTTKPLLPIINSSEILPASVAGQPNLFSTGLYAGILFNTSGDSDNARFQGVESGMNLQFYFSPHWSITGGLGVSYQRARYKLEQMREMNTNPRGSLLQQEIVTNIPKGVLYIQLPLSLNLGFNRHIISGGVIISKNLSERVERTSELFDNNDLSTPTTDLDPSSSISVQNVWVNSTFFSPVLTQASVQYFYQVKSRLFFGAGFRYSLNSELSRDNDDPSIKSRNLYINASVRIGL